MASLLISIPEYFIQFINRSIDLAKIPRVYCPFHEGDTPSSSYSSKKGPWRCFGACKVGGDVITLHQESYRLGSRREAENSLYKLLGLHTEGSQRRMRRGVADEHAAAFKTTYVKTVMVACTVED